MTPIHAIGIVTGIYIALKTICSTIGINTTTLIICIAYTEWFYVNFKMAGERNLSSLKGDLSIDTSFTL
jgi:hypothetical protein